MASSISGLVFDFFIRKEGCQEEKSHIELLDGEQIVKTLNPHPLSFYDMYLIWLWIIFVSVVFMLYGGAILSATFDPLSIVPEYLPTAPSDNAILDAIPGLTDTTEKITTTVSETVSLVQSYSVVALWLVVLLLSSLLISVFKIEF
ncbi:MAG: hypothetical protein KKD39_05910, partial [Candidatus Altiarchaeota archaeon]|nr:hypothetical protein [Candidatus Altiarchaeota archaeon]